ncbi:MAG: glycosyltransferase family 8 protein [Prevotella sp.]
MIHIACCSNEKLAPMFGVVMASVGINVKSDDVMMYLLHNGLKDKTIKRLNKIAERFHIALELMEINASLLKDCPTNKKLHYADIMTFARFLLPSMLPKLKKVLYLDCDLVVHRDLKPLWDFDIEDVAVAMAPDHVYHDKKTLERLNIPNGAYLNAGVMLMNLDYWRKHNLQKRMLEFIAEKGKQLTFLDQDALNVVLQNERKELPLFYNVSPFHFFKENVFLPGKMLEEVEKARNNPVIFHYIGKAKPWSLGSYVPGKELFMHYQKQSGWRHFTIQKHLLKRIIYTLAPFSIKKNAWEDKTYIEGWKNFYSEALIK